MDGGWAIASHSAGARRASCLLLGLLIAMPASPKAASLVDRWHLDPARSRIGFELTALGVISISGRFEQFEGTVERDVADGRLRVSIRIDAASLAMRSRSYLDWARSPEFFHVQRYPDIRFLSEPLSERALAQGGALVGVLELREIAHPVRFEIAPVQCLQVAAPCEIHVTGEINRGEFGMRSRRMTLSSRVRLDMRVLAVPVPPSTPEDAP